MTTPAPKNVNFPLPDNYFPNINLSEEDKLKFKQWGQSLLDETLEGYYRDKKLSLERRELKWKPLKTVGECVAYRRRKFSNPNAARYLLMGEVTGTVEEVMFGRYADNTKDYRRINAIYRPDLIDCAVVQCIDGKKPEDPFYFSGIKWMALSLPGGGLLKARDVLWYEQAGFIRDHDGKELAYSVADTIEYPSCPPFANAVRVVTSLCYLYRQHPQKPGTIEVYMRAKNKAGGKLMNFLADRVVADIYLNVDDLIQCAYAKIAADLVEHIEALPDNQQHKQKKRNTNSKCDVCREKQKNRMFTSSCLQDCAICQRVACSECCVEKRILNSVEKFLEPRMELICKKCMQLIHEAPLRDPYFIEYVHKMAMSSRRGARPSVDSTHYSTPIDSRNSIISLPVDYQYPNGQNQQGQYQSPTAKYFSGMGNTKDIPPPAPIFVPSSGPSGMERSEFSSNGVPFSSSTSKKVIRLREAELDTAQRSNGPSEIDNGHHQQKQQLPPPHQQHDLYSQETIMQKMVEINIMAENVNRMVKENERQMYALY